MTTLKMAHMHYVACGPTCNIMHVGPFSVWSFDPHLDVQLLNRYVTYGRNVELTDDIDGAALMGTAAVALHCTLWPSRIPLC